MNDEQPQQDSPQPEAPRARKPGFFSRLFTAKQVEAPADTVAASTEIITTDVDGENVAIPEFAEEAAAGPEGFNAQPVLEEAPAARKRGVFSRWFGGKEETPEGEPEPDAAEPAETPAPAAPKKSWFQRLRERLRRGSGSFIAAVRAAIGLSGRLDEETIEKLEEILIASDVAMETTLKIIERMRKRARSENIEGAEAIMELFKETVREVFAGNARVFEPRNPQGPYIVMVVGVNGVGKTTTIGKMAKRCCDAGLKVMIVAGDTFRAAAIEQLEIWSKRVGAQFLKSRPNADPSGLAFDALKSAQSHGIDVVFIDTAGRLHTKSTLMDELGKIARVCQKVIPDAPHETLLVLDATTGQNAIQQVKLFSKAVPVTGLVMTKLDGTAKGGILITIRDQFDIPVTLIGVGEGIDDLRDFDPAQFTAALFEEEEATAR